MGCSPLSSMPQSIFIGSYFQKHPEGRRALWPKSVWCIKEQPKLLTVKIQIHIYHCLSCFSATLPGSSHSQSVRTSQEVMVCTEGIFNNWGLICFQIMFLLLWLNEWERNEIVFPDCFFFGNTLRVSRCIWCYYPFYKSSVERIKLLLHVNMKALFLQIFLQLCSLDEECCYVAR